MRKYLAAALLGLLFVSAAGCAGTKDAGEQPAETENGTGNETEEAEASGGLKAPEGELSEEVPASPSYPSGLETSSRS